MIAKKMDCYKESLHYYLKNRKRGKAMLRLSVFFRQKILKKFEVPYMEMFITTKCNLKCRHCSSLIPYLEKSVNITFEEFKRDIDALLEKIDRLYRLKLHGGEVFLNPDLCAMIKYADREKKIKSLRIATNGTIIPSKEILSVLADSKVKVQISDYPAFSDKADKLEEQFSKHGIKYVRMRGQKWRDMGDGFKRQGNRFKDCTISRCTSIYKGKVYVCSRAAMIEELGYCFCDGVDLALNRNAFRRELSNLYLGMYSAACYHCDGDTEFAAVIPTGEQIS